MSATDNRCPIDYPTLALRICAAGADISAALAQRTHIDQRFADVINLRTVWPPRPMLQSLTAAEQTECWAEMELLDAELEDMCRLTGGGATKDEPSSISALTAAMSEVNLAAGSSVSNLTTAGGGKPGSRAAGNRMGCVLQSLTAAEQTECWAEMELLDAELEDMCRLTGGGATKDEPSSISALTAAMSEVNLAAGSSVSNLTTAGGGKPGSRAAGNRMGCVSRQQSLRRQESQKRDSLVSQSGEVAGEETTATDDSLEEPLVTLAEIQAFNATAPAEDEADCIDDLQVQTACDHDKQSIRPLFKLVPKLKEFTTQIQTVIANAARATQRSNASSPGAVARHELSALLARLQELMVDVNYLDEHPNIYDVRAVQPFDDPVLQCFEELFKQIMNQ